ncbi:hypothetical protein [Candidatus Methylobacter oryzae]|uniref:Uncharacterized protein n=1 Tax=Candidatus Methylobacter oryzae TaxID=2497749 RepID=A0ABY3C9I3_9GAMM|nr:hypothetical protein [Candidatus Methylobacter oryzae]TRW93323.1 hypothetical protein EKO24_012790 [Candidatus Methylobacter oryzae]
MQTKLQRGRPAKKRTGKLGKTEILQFRLDPLSRFAMEVAARCQKRTLSNMFDVAIDSYINQCKISWSENKNIFFNQEDEESIPLMGLIHKVWDQDEAKRFLNLAQTAPSLLSSEERVIWDFISRERVFWRSSKTENKEIVYIELVQALWDDLKDMEPWHGLESLENFKERLLQIQDQNQPEKIAALRNMLNELFPYQ